LSEITSDGNLIKTLDEGGESLYSLDELQQLLNEIYGWWDEPIPIKGGPWNLDNTRTHESVLDSLVEALDDDILFNLATSEEMSKDIMSRTLSYETEPQPSYDHAYVNRYNDIREPQQVNAGSLSDILAEITHAMQASSQITKKDIVIPKQGDLGFFEKYFLRPNYVMKAWKSNKGYLDTDNYAEWDRSKPDAQYSTEGTHEWEAHSQFESYLHNLIMGNRVTEYDRDLGYPYVLESGEGFAPGEMGYNVNIKDFLINKTINDIMSVTYFNKDGVEIYPVKERLKEIPEQYLLYDMKSANRDNYPYDSSFMYDFPEYDSQYPWLGHSYNPFFPTERELEQLNSE